MNMYGTYLNKLIESIFANYYKTGKIKKHSMYVGN